jgi:glycosyltransferase involved in cell wall biosynthesis
MSVDAPITGRHVVVVVENLSVPFDRRVWRECNALRDAGYEVTAISPKGVGRDSASREVIDGISVFRYPTLHSNGGFLSYGIEYSIAVISSFVLMCYAYAHRRFHLIQICNPPELLIFAAAPFRLVGVPIIFDQHDLSPEIYAAQTRSGLKQRLVLAALRFFERLTYRYADVVMVVNDSCRRIALERGQKSDRGIFVVRNGPTKQAIQTARASQHLKQGKQYLIGYVGMMGPQEGIDGLLRILRILVVDLGRHDVHLRIVGGGTVLEEMRRYAVELGVHSYVTFTGPGSYEQVLECIASADVCVCPDPKTPLSDKCSLVKAVEYMSVGRAFVAFDLVEVRHMAGDAALYATPGDEAAFADLIVELLHDANKREVMGRRGRERAWQSLTWDSAVQNLYAAYEAAYQRRAR